MTHGNIRAYVYVYIYTYNMAAIAAFVGYTIYFVHVYVSVCVFMYMCIYIYKCNCVCVRAWIHKYRHDCQLLCQSIHNRYGVHINTCTHIYENRSICT